MAVAACGASDTGSLLGGGGGGSGPTSPGAKGVNPGGGGGSGGGGGLSDGGAADTTPPGPTPEQLFNALEPQLFMSCGTCHGVSGQLTMAPKWLLGPDRYATIKAYPGIIVPDVASSLLLTIGDTVQHSGGPGLSDVPPVNLRDQVTNWLIAEAAAISSKPLPSTDPFKIHNGANTVDISKGGVKGAQMGFTCAIDGSTITFTDVTVTAPSSMGLHIVHPVFAISEGPEAGAPVGDVSDSFSNVDEMVPAGQTLPLGVGLFVLDVAATIGSNWSASDEIEIQFNELVPLMMGDGGTTTEGGAGGCKAVATYTADAVPAIMANTCLNCHAGANPTATSALDMTQVGKNNTAACAQALTQVNLKNPSQSNIILAPTGGLAAHPFKGASSAYTTMMLNWINAE